MSGVVLGNRLDLLTPLLPPVTEPVRLVVLDDSRDAVAIQAYFRHRSGTTDVPLKALNRARSARIRAAYVEAIGRLNAERASLHWWAMPFTTKNPIATSLCRDTFAFLLIVDLVARPGGLLVVVTQSLGLAEQVTEWARAQGIAVRNAIHPAWDTVRWINTHLPLLALGARVARALWLKAVLQVSGCRPALGTRVDVLMVTLVHPSSVLSAGRFRDTYFGELSRWLRARHLACRVASIVDRLSVKLARAFCANSDEQGTLSLDAMPRSVDILRSAWNAYRSYRESTVSTDAFDIDGVTVDVLLGRAVQDAHTSGNVFFHLCVYHAARSLASAAHISRCLYPYENKAWEKMFLLGVREVSPRTKCVGYQHTSVTPSHTNFMLAEKEQGVVPLPDRVVTMGTFTRDWLIREGRHAPDRLAVGCALRQARSGAEAPRRRRLRQPHRLLVTLATNLEEYVRVLLLLRGAAAERWEIAIRPHPTISLPEASLRLPGESVGFPHRVSKGSLADDLAWADAVLYASSTVGLEAVGAGVPAVFMDLGDILSTDPMDGWSDFKWIVREPADLKTVLDDIAQLSDEHYERRQQAGCDYARAYLHPVTDAGLEAFLQPC